MADWAGVGAAPAADNYTWGGDPAARRKVNIAAQGTKDQDPYNNDPNYWMARDAATGDWVWTQAGEMKPYDTTGKTMLDASGYGQYIPADTANPGLPGSTYGQGQAPGSSAATPAPGAGPGLMGGAGGYAQAAVMPGTQGTPTAPAAPFLGQAPGAASNLPGYGFDSVKGVQEAILSRLQPQMQDSRNQEIQRLKAQGITEGSAAWNSAIQNLDRAQNDMNMQALLGGATEFGNIYNRALSGSNQDQSWYNSLNQNRRADTGQAMDWWNAQNTNRRADTGQAMDWWNAQDASNRNWSGLDYEQGMGSRNQALQEALLQSKLPLEQAQGWASLMEQMNLPGISFGDFMGAQGYDPTDIFGASQAQYEDQVQRTNAKNAGSSGLFGTLAGVAGTALGGPIGGALAKTIAGKIG